ncbi:ABC transporter permease [Pseudorhodoplanes sp.]|uniref:ABC transporter permease n=1 Tax=Pseudorhodoplanes sp. TaxID=1934341 RepID=UPI003D13304C
MTRFILNRLALSLFMLLGVSILTFVGTELLPGDVASAILGQDATPEALDALRRKLHLYDPAIVRYFRWLGHFFTGDFGNSLVSGRSVLAQLSERLPNTLFLAGFAALFALPFALIIGTLAAIQQDQPFDRMVNSLCMGLGSLPEFFVCYCLILVIAVNLGWLPSLSAVSPDMSFSQHFYVTLLPMIALAVATVTHPLRMTRAAIMGVMSQPYIEMAFLKGMPRWRVVIFHALPNALAPIITVTMLAMAWLIVGVVVIEVVFVYPGVGQLMVDAVAQRDLPIVQACGLIFAGTYIGLNLLADVLAIVVSPRLRLR